MSLVEIIGMKSSLIMTARLHPLPPSAGSPGLIEASLR